MKRQQQPRQTDATAASIQAPSPASMKPSGSNALRLEQLKQRQPVHQTKASMPFAPEIQASFGPAFNIGGIDAQVGGQAGKDADAMNAKGFAAGNRVGFSGSPDLHTAAHEAAHVFQQRQGIQLTGNGVSDGPYERHADRVADAVVRGEDASPILSEMGSAQGTGRGGLQFKLNTDGGTPPVVTGQHESDLLKKMDGYVEAPPGVENALDVFAAFLSNDQQVPEKIKFGPTHPMTRTVQGDGGVAEARAKYKSDGWNEYRYKFSFLEFARETLELSLTSHFLGSYTVWMAPTDDGRVLFMVYNLTSRQSAARNPIPPDMRPDEGVLGEENLMDWESGTRDEVDWGGNVHQIFYWYEDEQTITNTPTESSMFGDVTPSAEGEAWDSRDNLENGLFAGGTLLGAGLGAYLGGGLGATAMGATVTAALPVMGLVAGGVGGSIIGGSLGGSLGGAIGGIFGETGEQWGTGIGAALGSFGGTVLGGLAGLGLGTVAAPLGGAIAAIAGGGLGAMLGGGLGALGGLGLGNLFGDDETKDSAAQSLWNSGTKVASALWDLF